MQKIGDIFAEIQEGASITNKQIYYLIDEFVKNPTTLINGLEQCYLKIIKMGSKSAKKPVEKFEKITEKFFHLIYQEATNTKSRKNIDENDVYGNICFLTPINSIRSFPALFELPVKWFRESKRHN